MNIEGRPDPVKFPCPVCGSPMKEEPTTDPGTASFYTLPSGSSSSSDSDFLYSEATTYVCTNPACGRRVLL